MGNENIHPAHKEILDQIPAEFHHLVIPTLKKWDTGVQQKFQEIHDSYADLKAYEQFVKNNIDPEYAERAILLADELQRDPAAIVAKVNQAWNLGFVSKDEAAKLGSQQEPDDDFVPDEGDDIFKDPRVKALKDNLDQLQQTYMQDKTKAEEEAELAEFEAYLNDLEEETKAKNLPFHRQFVTALISQGLDGEDAVKQYHQVLAGNVEIPDTTDTQQTQETSAPPVMGGEGTAGSGSADGSIEFGSLSKNQLNSTIEQMLTQQAQSGQG